MPVMGLHCSFEELRPVVRGVVLSGPRASPVVDRKFTHRAIKDEDLPTQLHKMAQDIRTQVSESQPSLVVVELRDDPPRHQRPPLAELQRRAMVDGVLLATAAGVTRTVGLRGVEVGQRYGKSKTETQDEAQQIIGVAAFKSAGAAALAALTF